MAGSRATGNRRAKKRTGGTTNSKRVSLSAGSKGKITPTARKKSETASATGDAKDGKDRAQATMSENRPKTGGVSKRIAARTARPRGAKRVDASRNSPLRAAVNPAAPTEGPPGEGRPLPKTHLSAKQLREFKRLLSAKREELAGDVAQLTDEAFNRQSQEDRGQTSMPIHMADLGTDNWEQDFTLGLLANERALILEIDEALTRIEKRTYGTCLATHRKIGLARLQAQPWAKFCIDYARAQEEGRAG